MPDEPKIMLSSREEIIDNISETQITADVLSEKDVEMQNFEMQSSIS